MRFVFERNIISTPVTSSPCLSVCQFQLWSSVSCSQIHSILKHKGF